MPPRIAYILPSYQNFDYSRSCLLSLHATSPFVPAIVVDDASPDWAAHPGWWQNTGGPVTTHRYASNGGLTRSWNAGVRIAEEFEPDYIVCGNSDVLFSPEWWHGLCKALDEGYAIVGPVSNSPGVTAPNSLQNVRRYMPAYTQSDDPGSIADAAWRLGAWYRGKVVPCPVNGFFMMAKACTWLEHGYSRGMPFPAAIRELTTGRRNETPAMTGQEDWIQAKLEKDGLKSGIVPSSFIFHYRSVSRGVQYAIGDFMRMGSSTSPSQ